MDRQDRQDFDGLLLGRAVVCRTVIPAYAGIRRRLDINGLVFSVPFWIPAYAGMTVAGRESRQEIRYNNPVYPC